jgi:hypothetical protein
VDGIVRDSPLVLAHLARCAAAILARAAADILRLFLGAGAAPSVAAGLNICRSSAIRALILFFCSSKPAMAAVSTSAWNFVGISQFILAPWRFFTGFIGFLKHIRLNTSSHQFREDLDRPTRSMSPGSSTNLHFKLPGNRSTKSFRPVIAICNIRRDVWHRTELHRGLEIAATSE